MTENELRDQLRPMLARRPYVPIRVEGMNGNAVFIDNPFGVEFQNGTVTIQQKLDGPRKVPVPASHIRQLTPLDELPGENGGMSYRDFIAAVRPFLRAAPFRVFVVELLDGTTLPVNRPGQLLLCSRVGSYEPEDRPGTVVFRVANVRRVLAYTESEVAGR